MARSSIFTGSPISKTNMLPFWLFTVSGGIAAACRTNDVASFTVMKKRVISGCVIVMGPPAAFAFRMRYHGTRRTQDITKPNRYELTKLTQAESCYKSIPIVFGRPHNISWVHCLICRDQDHDLNILFNCC